MAFKVQVGPPQISIHQGQTILFDAEAAQIAHDIGKAASYFQLNQLPEFYTAFQRDETTFSSTIYRCERATGVGGGGCIHAHTGDVGIHARRAAQHFMSTLGLQAYHTFLARS